MAWTSQLPPGHLRRKIVDVLGFNMGLTWAFYGLKMDFIWVLDGLLWFTLVFKWFFMVLDGLPMVLQYMVENPIIQVFPHEIRLVLYGF